MAKMVNSRGTFVLVIAALFAGAAGGQTRAAPKPEKPPPRIKRLGPDLYGIGPIKLDARKRRVRLPARVNMDVGGPIELLLCLPSGKTHESVLTADIQPVDLQVALLLLGLKQGANPALERREGAPPPAPPGDAVLIWVQWDKPPETEQDGPETVRLRAERLLHNVETNRPAREAQWVFLGSQMLRGRFGADIEGSLISTYHDPLSILELCLPTVNDDVYYVVNEETCPPAGTRVEVQIEMPPKPEPDPADDTAKGEGDEPDQADQSGKGDT